MKKQINTFQAREQDKTPGKELNEAEINNLPDKEFKQKVIRMLTDLGRRLDEHNEIINKELKNTKKKQSKMKNMIQEMKNSLEGGLKSRVDDTEEQISELDKRLEEIIQAEQKKQLDRMRTV